MTESTENTAVNENKEVPTCEDKNCPVCATLGALAEKKEKTLHDIIVERINDISEKKAKLLEKADSAQDAIDWFIKMDAEISAGLIPEATLHVLKEMMD